MNIGIVGSAGRMGQMLIKEVAANPDTTLSDQGDQGDSPRIFENPNSEAVIDFTTPDATMEHVKLATQHKKILIIGTTGLSDAQDAEITKAAKIIPIVYAPNFSLGVNIMMALVETAAAALPDIFKITMDDIHHVHKKDAPSGTAIGLAKTAAAARHTDWRDIPIQSQREGEHIGTHVVHFATPDEVIGLSHIAIDRAIFAKGAIFAAIWAKTRPPGLYSMRDVLGL